MRRYPAEEKDIIERLCECGEKEQIVVMDSTVENVQYLKFLCLHCLKTEDEQIILSSSRDWELEYEE